MKMIRNNRIEEISIFSNSRHFEWKAELSDTILKGIYPKTIPARFGIIWFCGFRGKDLNVIFYQNMPILHTRNKSAERKISQKKSEIYVKLLIAMQLQLKFKLFLLIIKQQWAIEEISIFSNNSHLEWRAQLSDTNLKGIHPGIIPARFGLIWFSGFREQDLNVIFYKNMPILHNRYKSAERNISQKNPEYMLNYSFPCSCSKHLRSFRFIIKQHWTIEEIFIFSYSSHLEQRVGLSDTILKGTHPRSIPTRFGLIWLRGFQRRRFKCESLLRTTTDAK